MKKEVPPEEAFASSPQKTASLNVMFNYNGHSFDAYETLGVPAGSDFSDVRTAYQKAIEGCDESSQDFFKTALDAIKNQK